MRYFSCVFFFLCAVLVSALAADIRDPAVYEHPVHSDDPDFKTVQESFSASPMVADYVQIKTIKRLNRSLESSGRMVIRPGTGIAWITEKPYASAMIVGRDYMKQQIGSRTVVMDVSENRIYLSIAEALESIFAGDFSHIDTVFDSFFLRDGDTWYLGLIPKDDAVQSFVQSITIQGTKTVDAVLLTEVSGDSILYTLENVEQRTLNSDEEKLFSL